MCVYLLSDSYKVVEKGGRGRSGGHPAQRKTSAHPAKQSKIKKPTTDASEVRSTECSEFHEATRAFISCRLAFSATPDDI